MAIESLDTNRVHSCKSDVWSYGIVLWEIHTYGILDHTHLITDHTYINCVYYIQVITRIMMMYAIRVNHCYNI